MSSQAVQNIYIVQDEEICSGRPRIAGTRLKVQHIALEYEYLGWPPDQICDAHPAIGLPEIHAAISYYYAHKEEIDQAIRDDREFADRLRKGVA
jgi:uncharacterized protein (DUF433 family)